MNETETIYTVIHSGGYKWRWCANMDQSTASIYWEDDGDWVNSGRQVGDLNHSPAEISEMLGDLNGEWCEDDPENDRASITVEQ